MPPIKLHRRESGLVVPEMPPPPPPEPQPLRGPLEIQDPDRRATAVEAFRQLWDAMDRSGPGGAAVCPLTRRRFGDYWNLWHYAAETLLGTDAPEREVNT